MDRQVSSKLRVAEERPSYARWLRTSMVECIKHIRMLPFQLQLTCPDAHESNTLV